MVVIRKEGYLISPSIFNPFLAFLSNKYGQNKHFSVFTQAEFINPSLGNFIQFHHIGTKHA